MISFKGSDDEVVVEATVVTTTPSPKPEPAEQRVCVYCQQLVPDECHEWVYGRHCFETVKHTMGNHLKLSFQDLQRTYIYAYKNAQHFH